MRGDAAMTARLVLRPSGVAGVGATVGGVVAILGALQHWHVVVAEVAMLGSEQERVVTAMQGLRVLTGGPPVLLAGCLAVALGLALAFDRHPGWTRPALVGVAGTFVFAVACSLLLRPPLSRFPDPEGAVAELAAVGAQLPTGVELHLHVIAGPGVWSAVLAAAVVLVATASARELATR